MITNEEGRPAGGPEKRPEVLGSVPLLVLPHKRVCGATSHARGRLLTRYGAAAPFLAQYANGWSALRRPYRTDAHAAGYTVTDAAGRWLPAAPRLRKEVLRDLPAAGLRCWLAWLMADLDSPGHQPLSPEVCSSETVAAVRAAVEARGLPRPAAYLTRRGARLVWPLAAPVEIIPATAGAVEARVRGVLARLASAGTLAGLEVDGCTTDWPRLYRLAYVVRDGDPQDPPAMWDAAPLDLLAFEPLAKTGNKFAPRSAITGAQAPHAPPPGASPARIGRALLHRVEREGLGAVPPGVSRHRCMVLLAVRWRRRGASRASILARLRRLVQAGEKP